MKMTHRAKLAKGAFVLSTVTSACLLAFNAQAALPVENCADVPHWMGDSLYAKPKTRVQHQGVVFENTWYANIGEQPKADPAPWDNWQDKASCGVQGNKAPTASLISPKLGDTAKVGDKVIISATAQDEDGSISRVDFYVGSELVGSASQSPYQVEWTAVAGNKVVVAKAYDDKNKMGESSTVELAVVDNLAPTVTIESPTSGSAFTVGQQASISVAASDQDGSIAAVEISLNNRALTVAAGSSYIANFVVELGDNVLLVKARDDKGAVTERSVTVTGAEVVNLAPEVALTLSANQVMPGDIVTLTATASDQDGTVSKVEFFAGDISAANKLGEQVAAPYELAYTAANAGAINIIAVATDDKGKTSTSVRNLTVSDGSTVSNCRPDGLYQTPGVNVPYCTVYDDEGREKMGVDHPRRVIGYFTSWRDKGNADQDYLVEDVPWEKLTHVNYAFAHVTEAQKIAVGEGQKAQLAQIAEYKQQHGVKTLISVGGWAETGGINTANGRQATGGFYKLTTNMDGSINHAGIAVFAKSAVEFIRQHKLDGVDIDYEYASAMTGAGHPGDFWISDKLRPHLMASYVELMRVLREELDKASALDSQHYMLTVAAPASGWLLRGMERYDANKYLDYINIMSYDLHGAWNEHVGHNASLYDTGKDPELAQVYAGAQYANIGYLNTDWAAHYYRGGMPAGRFNIGVPYYTRGWEKVQGGENGLWGNSKGSNCPDGTFGKCGAGATGINNVWHDVEHDREVAAGSNPAWHAKNLENGVLGTYLKTFIKSADYQGPADAYDKIEGTYTRYYDAVAVAPWLWNPQTKTFLSMEDKESIMTKAQYVIDQDIGGIMFWELAGDYACYPYDSAGKRTTIVDQTEAACNTGNGEYHMGETMTSAIYEAFKSARPYGNKLVESAIPAQALDMSITLDKQSADYPITTDIIITNNSGTAIDETVTISFDYPTSAPANAIAGDATSVSIVSGHDGDNIGGLRGNFHRISFNISSYQKIPSGETGKFQLTYNHPITGPVNYTVTVDGVDYATSSEFPSLPLADLCQPAGLYVYPDFPHKGWKDYLNKGEKMVHNGAIWTPSWGSANTEPSESDTSWTKICTIK